MQAEHSSDGISIHAGFPNPATDTSMRGLDLNQLLVQHSASTYMFRVQGSNWEEVGVFDGDVAIIDRALDARPTDLVAWWDDTEGTFALSYCKTMPSDASQWGVVTATIHQFRKSSKSS